VPLLHWDQLTREELAETAPQAVAVFPIGATEQHGPHLASGTDTILVTAVAERACAAASAPAVLAPSQPFGWSDHHVPFGATLSLSHETLVAVLCDLLRSAAAAGFPRAVLVNGHGGNVGVIRVAAAKAAREHGLTVAATSYWELAPAPQGVRVPGHGGLFETSLALAIDPGMVRPGRARPSPGDLPPAHPGVRVERPEIWSRLDGFTDDPTDAEAESGERWLAACADALRQVVDELHSGKNDFQFS
jgi:creatinine amidohydrolase